MIKEIKYNDLEFVIMLAISKADDSEKFRKDMYKSKRKILEEIWLGNYYQEIGNIVRFAPSACKTLGVSNLRLYASVNNAFLLCSSDFTGYDPEGTSQGTSQWGQNMYFFQYPKPRTWTLGLNVTF